LLKLFRKRLTAVFIVLQLYVIHIVTEKHEFQDCLIFENVAIVWTKSFSCRFRATRSL